MDDLWQIAFGRLSPDLKASFNVASANGVDSLYVLTAVLNEAEEKKHLCLQKRWKVRFQEQTVVLRDIIDKIISWVNQLRAVEDIAGQLHSTAASLPWVGVRFLLEVIGNSGGI